MDAPLFANPFIYLVCGGRRKSLVNRPMTYNDAIECARRHIMVAKSAQQEAITLLVRIASQPEFLTIDKDIWPHLAVWINEIQVEVNCQSHESLLVDEQLQMVPVAGALNKRKRESRSTHIGFPLRSRGPIQHSEQSEQPPVSPYLMPSTRPRPQQTRTLRRAQPPRRFRDNADEMISLQAHKKLIQDWLNENPEQPFVVPPAYLHDNLTAYLSRPFHVRDDSLLPKHPAQRHWVHKRCRLIKGGLNRKNQGLIADESSALHAVLVCAHGKGEHRNLNQMKDNLRKKYAFRPCNEFIRFWISSCPGC